MRPDSQSLCLLRSDWHQPVWSGRSDISRLNQFRIPIRSYVAWIGFRGLDAGDAPSARRCVVVANSCAHKRHCIAQLRIIDDSRSYFCAAVSRNSLGCALTFFANREVPLDSRDSCPKRFEASSDNVITLDHLFSLFFFSANGEMFTAFCNPHKLSCLVNTGC